MCVSWTHGLMGSWVQDGAPQQCPFYPWKLKAASILRPPSESVSPRGVNVFPITVPYRSPNVKMGYGIQSRFNPEFKRLRLCAYYWGNHGQQEAKHVLLESGHWEVLRPVAAVLCTTQHGVRDTVL